MGGHHNEENRGEDSKVDQTYPGPEAKESPYENRGGCSEQAPCWHLPLKTAHESGRRRKEECNQERKPSIRLDFAGHQESSQSAHDGRDEVDEEDRAFDRDPSDLSRTSNGKDRSGRVGKRIEPEQRERVDQPRRIL